MAIPARIKIACAAAALPLAPLAYAGQACVDARVGIDAAHQAIEMRLALPPGVRSLALAPFDGYARSELLHSPDASALVSDDMLRALVIDVDNDHNTRDTGRRLAKMFVRELFAGRYQQAPAVTEFPNAERLNELMIVGPITVRSACSHHLCPIIGKVWIGLLPSEHSNLIGLSKYVRLTEWVMSRPQIQEEAVVMLANELQERVQPDGLAIVMDADHFCMHWRGVKDMDSTMTNSVMRGSFLKDATLRAEFLALMKQKG